MNSLMIYVPLLVKLSDSEKRALQILIVFIAIAFIIISGIASLIKKKLEKEGRSIDGYMYDFIRYGIIKNPSEFKSYVFKRESRNLYLSLRWAMRLFFLVIGGYIVYVIFAQLSDFKLTFQILGDMFFKLDWPKVKVFGITLVSDWPTILKSPNFHLTLMGYLTYISAIASLAMFFKLAKVTLTFIGRIQRSNKVAIASFSKDLEGGVDLINEE